VRLILVRHADAADAAAPTEQADFDRQLTAAGRRQATHLAAALRRIRATPDAILCSPLVRTAQTAEALAPEKPGSHSVITTDDLRPDALSPTKVSKAVGDLRRDTVLVVGHMPDIGRYAAWLIGAASHAVPFERCGAACVSLWGDRPEEGRGTLEWFVTPAWCERLSEVTFR
jgi:phosphohistidine phosphatase